MTSTLTGAERRKLRGQAQRLDATLKVGRAGLSAPFLQALDDALKRAELVKVRFDEFKTERKQLAPQLAEKTASELICLVGHVAVFYRRKPEAPAEGAGSRPATT